MALIVDVSVEVYFVERVEVIKEFCLVDWTALLLKNVDEMKALWFIALEDISCSEKMGYTAVLRGWLLQKLLEKSLLLFFLHSFKRVFLVKGYLQLFILFFQLFILFLQFFKLFL